MKTIVRISRLLILAGLVLAACQREPAAQSRPAPAPTSTSGRAPAANEAQSAQLTCTPPRRVCTGCTGAPTCAIRCPECPPPAAPSGEDAPAQSAALTGVSAAVAYCAPASDR